MSWNLSCLYLALISYRRASLVSRCHRNKMLLLSMISGSMIPIGWCFLEGSIPRLYTQDVCPIFLDWHVKKIPYIADMTTSIIHYFDEHAQLLTNSSTRKHSPTSLRSWLSVFKAFWRYTGKGDLTTLHAYFAPNATDCCYNLWAPYWRAFLCIPFITGRRGECYQCQLRWCYVTDPFRISLNKPLYRSFFSFQLFAFLHHSFLHDAVCPQ